MCFVIGGCVPLIPDESGEHIASETMPEVGASQLLSERYTGKQSLSLKCEWRRAIPLRSAVPAVLLVPIHAAHLGVLRAKHDLLEVEQRVKRLGQQPRQRATLGSLASPVLVADVHGLPVRSNLLV